MSNLNALILLKQDHKTVNELLKQIFDSTEDIKEKEKLFDEVIFLIKTHKLLEEKYFYPILKQHEKIKMLTLEAYEEHALVDELLKKLEKEDCNTDEWCAKFKIMKELIEHHVKEEENDIFPLVKKHISDEQLHEMGEKMQALKEEADKG